MFYEANHNPSLDDVTPIVISGNSASIEGQTLVESNTGDVIMYTESAYEGEEFQFSVALVNHTNAPQNRQLHFELTPGYIEDLVVLASTGQIQLEGQEEGHAFTWVVIVPANSRVHVLSKARLKIDSQEAKPKTGDITIQNFYSWYFDGVYNNEVAPLTVRLPNFFYIPLIQKP